LRSSTSGAVCARACFAIRAATPAEDAGGFAETAPPLRSFMIWASFRARFVGFK
jgi:hypothetical protein